jgi:hypothetical protein
MCVFGECKLYHLFGMRIKEERRTVEKGRARDVGKYGDTRICSRIGKQIASRISAFFTNIRSTNYFTSITGSKYYGYLVSDSSITGSNACLSS